MPAGSFGDDELAGYWSATPDSIRVSDVGGEPLTRRRCRECGTLRDARPHRAWARLLDCESCGVPTLHLDEDVKASSLAELQAQMTDDVEQLLHEAETAKRTEKLHRGIPKRRRRARRGRACESYAGATRCSRAGRHHIGGRRYCGEHAAPLLEEAA